MVQVGENWVCPYCQAHQAITEPRHTSQRAPIYVQNTSLGPIALVFEGIACANPKCRKLTFAAAIRQRNVNGDVVGTPLHSWQLLPESSAKPLPAFIPDVLVQDYTEACRIRDLSPKASATLARRCLQGMIRDFCSVPKQRSLWHEIEELKKLVDAGKAPRGVQADSMDAIHAVREVGNVGAHMEADINLLVDVDPGEAQTLIELIELLFDEWYIEREKRRVQLGKITAAADRVKSQQQT